MWRFDSSGQIVKRFDAGTLGQVLHTPQGGLRIPSFPTRSGVFPYRQPDGSIRLEYRPASEVFDPESLASMANAPVTDLHPELYGVRVPVTPENWRAVAVGHVGPEITQEGSHVAVDLLIQDSLMITMVQERKRRELSCGYECQIDQTPGVSPEGEKYDVIQRRIRYNHVAVGPEGWGRAGPTVALRSDSGDAEQIPERTDQVEKETINGVEYIVGSKEHTAALRGQRDLAMGRADSLDKALTAEKAKAPVVDQAAINKAAQVRADLLLICHRAAKASKTTFDDKAAAAMSSDQLVIQAILALDPGAEIEGKSPEYISGVLDTLIRTMKASTEEGKPEEVATPVVDPANPAAPRTDGKTSPLFTARQGTAPVKGADKVEDRNDSDLAEKDFLQRNRARGMGPLDITRGPRA